MIVGAKRPLVHADGKLPRKSARTEEPPPAGTIKSYALIPTTGPCYENPIDLRFPLHWNALIFQHRWEPKSVEIKAAEDAVRGELGRLGVLVGLVLGCDVPHIPGTRCPPLFHLEVEDTAEWDVWKHVQGTVFKAIAKHFYHLEGFRRPVLRWNLLSDDPYYSEDMSLPMFDLEYPQRPPTSSAARTRIVTATEAYVPDTGPPYETPLDLRFPLHWDTTASITWVKAEESSPIMIATKATQDLWDCIFRPGIIALRLCIAERIEHYPEGISAPYFQVVIDDRETWTMDIHEAVVATVQKCWGHLKGYEQPIFRYVVARRKAESFHSEGESDSDWDPHFD